MNKRDFLGVSGWRTIFSLTVFKDDYQTQFTTSNPFEKKETTQYLFIQEKCTNKQSAFGFEDGAESLFPNLISDFVLLTS